MFHETNDSSMLRMDALSLYRAAQLCRSDFFHSDHTHHIIRHQSFSNVRAYFLNSVTAQKKSSGLVNKHNHQKITRNPRNVRDIKEHLSRAGKSRRRNVSSLEKLHTSAASSRQPWQFDGNHARASDCTGMTAIG